MSHYIVLVNWSGVDINSATPQMAKVFRMSPNRAANIMEGFAKGVSWKFEKTISDSQASQAQNYLKRIGFKVEIFPVESSEVEVTPKEALTSETPLAEPPPAQQENKESLFSKLKSMGGPKEGSSKPKEVKKEAVSSPTQVEEPPPYKRGYQAEEEGNTKEIVRTSPVAQLFMVLLIILFLALGALPYWLGMQIEIKFNQLPIQVAKSEDMVWINTRFDRKWFESEAENILKFPKHDLTFKMTHKISHGFLLFGEILRGDYKRNIIKILDGKIEPYLGQGILDSKVVFVNQSQNLPNFSPLNIKNRVRLDGSIFGEFNMPIYKNPPGQPFFLSWQGLNGTATLSSDFKNVLIKASAFPLLVRDGENIFLINQVRAELNSQERPGGQKVLAFSVGVDRVTYRKKKQVASFRNLDFIGNSIESGFDQSITLTSIMERYEDGKEKYGPATMAMQLRNLNPVILKSLREKAFIFSKTGGKDSKTISKIRELLNGLKNKPPQFEVTKIELDTPKGKIDGALLADYKGIDIPSTGFNPLMLLNGIEVKGRMGLPAVYLDQDFKSSEDGKQVTMQIPVKDFEEKGFISKDGNRYVTQLEWEKGVLKLNGKPFDLMPN